jgi:(hydroxyamino)benzene mutase
MTDELDRKRTGRRLLRWGVALFFLGLVTGLAVPKLANPRMGLSSHLQGLMNGMFLVLLGVVWPRLRLSRRSSAVVFWLALYGTFVNWATTLCAAFLGAGGGMMPIAAPGRTGTWLEELLIDVGLVSLSIAMLTCCGFVLWGLRGADE